MDKWLGDELQEILNDDPKRSNNISFEDFKLSIALGDLSLNNVKITPVQVDSSQSLVAAVDRFDIKGVSLYHLFLNREIITETLTVEKPNIRLAVSSEQAVVGNSENINNLWADILTGVIVRDFLVKDAKIVIEDQETGVEQLNMQEVYLTVTKIEIDTSTIDDPFPFKYENINLLAKDITADLNEFIIKIPKLAATENTVQITDLKVVPKSVDRNGQKLTISAGLLDINRFDWGFYKEEFYLKVKTLDIENADLTVSKEKYTTSSLTEKPLLASRLAALPITMHVDSVTIKKSMISYQKLNDETGEIGTIEFNDVYATAYNITNDSLKLTKNHLAMIDLKSQFMGISNLDAHFELDLVDGKDGFRGNGKLGATNVDGYNKMLVPLAGVRAKGDLSNFEFTIMGDKYTSTGSLNMDYENLQIAVLNNETQKKNLFLSSLAGIVIDNNNRTEDKGYRQGTISASKVKHKSFLHYLWISLKSGIIDIVAPKLNQKKKSKKR